ASRPRARSEIPPSPAHPRPARRGRGPSPSPPGLPVPPSREDSARRYKATHDRAGGRGRRIRGAARLSAAAPADCDPHGPADARSATDAGTSAVDCERWTGRSKAKQIDLHIETEGGLALLPVIPGDLVTHAPGVLKILLEPERQLIPPLEQGVVPHPDQALPDFVEALVILQEVLLDLMLQVSRGHLRRPPFLVGDHQLAVELVQRERPRGQPVENRKIQP